MQSLLRVCASHRVQTSPISTEKSLGSRKSELWGISLPGRDNLENGVGRAHFREIRNRDTSPFDVVVVVLHFCLFFYLTTEMAAKTFKRSPLGIKGTCSPRPFCWRERGLPEACVCTRTYGRTHARRTHTHTPATQRHIQRGIRSHTKIPHHGFTAGAVKNH